MFRSFACAVSELLKKAITMVSQYFDCINNECLEFSEIFC